MKKTITAALSCFVLFAAVAFTAPSQAAEYSAWHPTTVAGGLTPDPSYLASEAMFSWNGGNAGLANVTVNPEVVNAPNDSVYNDYSVRPTTATTNVAGDQSNTNVETDASLGAGSTLTTSTTTSGSGTSTGSSH